MFDVDVMRTNIINMCATGALLATVRMVWGACLNLHFALSQSCLSFHSMEDIDFIYRSILKATI